MISPKTLPLIRPDQSFNSSAFDTASRSAKAKRAWVVDAFKKGRIITPDAPKTSNP